MESVADSSRTPSSAYSNGSSNYSDSSWPPAKGSIISTEGTTKTTMTSLSVNRKPDGRIKIRTLCLLGALLPGIGCYICVIYTYVFQFDRVMNFTSTNCDSVKRQVFFPTFIVNFYFSPFPPISYSIGVWKPQKYIWLIVLALHMPVNCCWNDSESNYFRLDHFMALLTSHNIFLGNRATKIQNGFPHCSNFTRD
jgi:hypothetical protein